MPGITATIISTRRRFIRIGVRIITAIAPRATGIIITSIPSHISARAIAPKCTIAKNSITSSSKRKTRQKEK